MPAGFRTPPISDNVAGMGRTFSLMLITFISGVILNLPYLAWMEGYYWPWTQTFPLSWGGGGLNAMSIFFHEIGHTVFSWFYGYVTIPVFDFSDGGGMAWQLTDQLIPLIIFINTALLFLIWRFKGFLMLQIIMALLVIFNLATAFSPLHMTIFDFAGPAAEIAFASFFLTRAWLDIAPRGTTERVLNGLIGWAMITRVFIQGWGLLYNIDMREFYYNQKGAHGFGDFDKVAVSLQIDFSEVVWIWLCLAIIGTAIPFILYCLKPLTVTPKVEISVKKHWLD